MIWVSRILVAAMAHAGVEPDEVLHPLALRFRSAGSMPRAFRSTLEPPGVAGMAGSLQRDAERIEMPEALPYLAGTWTGGNVRLTALALSDAAVWYGRFEDAQVNVRCPSVPTTLLQAMPGRRLAEVIDHPVLAGGDETVLGATHHDGRLTLRIGNEMIQVEPRATAIDAVQAMLAA